MNNAYKTIKEFVKYFCFKRAHTTCFVDSCCGGNWGKCSKRHDRRYENKRLNRKQADVLFYRCVRRTTGRTWHKYVAFTFAKTAYGLVRLFGWTRYGKK